MNDCEKYAALLDAFIDGECSPEEAEQVREHLKTCSACRNEVEMALAMRDAFPDAEDTEVPAAFSAGVMEAIRSGRSTRNRRSIPWKRALVSLAACCAVAVLIHFAPFGSNSTAQSGTMQAYLSAGSSDAASGSTSQAESPSTGTEDRSFTRSVPSEEAGGSGSSEQSGSGSAEESTPTQKKTPSTQKSAAAETIQKPVTTAGAEPPTEASGSDTGSSPDAGNDTSAPGNSSDILGSSAITAAGGGSASDDSSNALTQLPEGIQAVQTVYRKQAELTEAEAGTALDSYEGTANCDASTGVTTTVYELEEADFDAIIAQLNAADKVTEYDPATTTLCCISVTS